MLTQYEKNNRSVIRQDAALDDFFSAPTGAPTHL
jgi:hypothetical protein